MQLHCSLHGCRFEGPNKSILVQLCGLLHSVLRLKRCRVAVQQQVQAIGDEGNAAICNWYRWPCRVQAVLFIG